MNAITYDEYQSRRYLPFLDGLRAVSILAVFLWHSPGPLLGFARGGRGVTVFFVLSGYLITMLALREESTRGYLDLGAFYLRRIFRILPLYYLMLAVNLVMVNRLPWLPNDGELNSHLPAYLFYFQDFPIVLNRFDYPFAVAWSLAIEEKFYLLWPIIGFVLLARSRYRTQLAVGLFAIIATAGLLTPLNARDLVAPYGTILLGCIAAMLLHDRRWFDRLRVLSSPWIIVTATIVSLVATSSLIALPFTIAVAILVVGLTTSSGFGTHWLSTRPLRHLGQLSYAFYLTHGIVFLLLEHPRSLEILDRAPFGLLSDPGTLESRLLMTAAAFVITLGISELLHRFFEVPMITLGRRIANRRSAAVAAVPSAAGLRGNGNT